MYLCSVFYCRNMRWLQKWWNTHNNTLKRRLSRFVLWRFVSVGNLKELYQEHSNDGCPCYDYIHRLYCIQSVMIIFSVEYSQLLVSIQLGFSYRLETWSEYLVLFHAFFMSWLCQNLEKKCIILTKHYWYFADTLLILCWYFAVVLLLKQRISRRLAED